MCSHKNIYCIKVKIQGSDKSVVLQCKDCQKVFEGSPYFIKYWAGQKLSKKDRKALLGEESNKDIEQPDDIKEGDNE